MNKEECHCPCHINPNVRHVVACCSDASVYEEMLEEINSCDCECHTRGNKKLHKAVPVCCDLAGEKFDG